MTPYIEPEKGLREAVDKAAKDFAYQAIASKEETFLIGNAMTRAIQVVLRYQQDHQSTKR